MGFVRSVLVFGVFLCIAPVSIALVEYVSFCEISSRIIDYFKQRALAQFQLPISVNLNYYGYNTVVSDSVRKLDESFFITITGKIPQKSVVTQEALAIVVCHELGHIFGKGPRQEYSIKKWSCVEGEADYYATNVCMKKVIKNVPFDKNLEHFDGSHIEKCQSHFSGKKVLDCLRILSGIASLKDFFNLGKTKNLVSLDIHDDRQVKKTLNNLPSDQCRVDTWLAGLFNQPRPSCWYKA